MYDLKNSDKVTENLSKELGSILKKCNKTIDSIEKEDWIYIFLITRLLGIQHYEDEQLWNDFCKEIIHKNRFFPESPILEKIADLAPILSIEIEPGYHLFRCREISEKVILSSEFIRHCIEFIKKELPYLALEDDDFNNSSKLSMIMEALVAKEGIEKKITDNYNEMFKNHDEFWGFDITENDAPPPEKTRSMRVNPEGISYLYAAEDIDTALLETRAQLGKVYSVATIEITKSIKLFDLTRNNIEYDEKNILKYSSYILSNAFSQTNSGNPLEYVPTQYICEYIKLEGFDGIRYKSSLSKDGTNIVLFDVDEHTKKYKLTHSSVYRIINNSIDKTKTLPITPKELEELLNENVKKTYSSFQIQKLKNQVLKIYNITKNLNREFNRPFTLDGHLLGSVGEVLASYYYGIELNKPSIKLHDGVVDEKEIQIKITQGNNIQVKGIPNYLIVLKIVIENEDLEVYEVYNGPGKKALEGKTSNSNNEISLSLKNLLLIKNDNKNRIPAVNDIKRWEQ